MTLSPTQCRRRRAMACTMPKLVGELQRQPKFEHQLRRTSKLHPRDFPARALAMGAAHELEHTDDPLVAVEIAMDHLADRKDYYRRLHRAIPNPGANKSDIKIPREWADELVAWAEFAPAAGEVGEAAKRGEAVDPVRARLAVEELRELAKTMQDKRLGRMAHVLRGKLENRIFEHELGIAEDNPGARKKVGKDVICTPCGPMECDPVEKGGRCKPLRRAKSNGPIKPFSIGDWRFDVDAQGQGLRAHKPRPRRDEVLAGDYSVAYPVKDAAQARAIAKAWVARTKGGRLPPNKAPFGKLKGAKGNQSEDAMLVPKKVGAALVGFMARECNFDFSQSTLTKVADASVAGRPVDVDELDEAAAELRDMAKAGFKRAGSLAEDLEDLLVDHIIATERGVEELQLRGGTGNGRRR